MRTVLVTGATSGIGRAFADSVSRDPVRLVIAGRDPDKTDSVRDELAAASGNSNVHSVLADFSSLQAVRDMADEVARRFDRLDVLFNNAGLLTDHRQESVDGLELTFTVNHLAPFLLTNRLLPLLTDSSPSRVIVNSSSAMGGGYINFDDLQMERQFDGWTAYANSKLANVYFSNMLAEKTNGSGVVSNALCPGLIDTNLLTGNRDFGPDYMTMLRTRMRPVEQGAEIPLFLANSDEAASVSGGFFIRSYGDGRQPARVADDRDTAERLWSVSLDLTAAWH